MKTRSIVIVAVAVLILILSGLYTMTGFYVVNPIPKVPAGEIIWFNRRGTNMPFLFSADGLAMKQSLSADLATRLRINATVAPLIEKRVIAILPYDRGIYLRTTGNRDFSSPVPKASGQ